MPGYERCRSHSSGREKLPIYEYYCPKCHKEFELMRSMSEATAQAKCPVCSTTGERLISAASSRVGFYYKTAAKPFRGQKSAPVKKPAKGASGKTKKRQTGKK